MNITSFDLRDLLRTGERAVRSIVPLLFVLTAAWGYHSADYGRNWRIDQAEMDRFTVLYNTRYTPPGTTRTGAYKVDGNTVDGFDCDTSKSPTDIITLSAYHSGDSSRNGKISLLELTRVIELYNYNNSGSGRTGEYHVQAGTEDGFDTAAAGSTAPSFQSSPQAQTVTAGNNATFAIVINGSTSITFQWQQLSTNGGSSWSNISGATSYSYTVTGATAGMNGYQYRCLASNSTQSNVASSAATLTVHFAPSFVSNPLV